MRLESALFSSREGLNAHGQALSVIGDNVSNANTVAYKTSRAEFIDILAEGDQGYQSTTLGGVGSGSAIGAVRQTQENGTIEATGRDLDVGIEGKGYFMLGDSAAPSYSRAGNFQISKEGTLVNADGMAVLGYGATGTTLGAINLLNFQQTAVPTTQATLLGNMSAEAAITTVPANPQTFNEIGALASSVQSFDVYDSLGARHTVNVAYFKTAANTFTAQAFMDGGDVGGTAGVPVQVGANATLNFSTAGIIEDANAANAIIKASPAYSGGAAVGAFDINLASFSQYALPSELRNVQQDGTGAGTVNGYKLDKDGSVYAQLDTGQSALLGRIQLASFVNVDGLVREGAAMYSQGADVGAQSTAAPGSSGMGTLAGSALERSTVDIATQFTDLVLYQRGYQANSQTLGAANTLIEQTLNLIR